MANTRQSVDAQSGNRPNTQMTTTPSRSAAQTQPDQSGTSIVDPDAPFGGIFSPDQSGPEYVEGGDNTEFYQDEFGTPVAWQEYLYDRLFDEIPNVAEAFGENPQTYAAWLSNLFPDLLRAVDRSINSDYLAPLDLTNTPAGFEFIYGIATNWLGSRDRRLQEALDLGLGARRSGGGGGGGGRSVAQQFDLDQLANSVRDIWRGTLLEEPKDARGIARAYVDAVTANPMQKLDFETFVLTRVEQEPRYASIYRNKPASMSAQQYMAPYFNMAVQVAAPQEAAKLAIGGAQFGADPNAFRNRLARTDAVTGSSPFISRLEQRLSNLKGVLKG
jgi:hypothetical protein